MQINEVKLYNSNYNKQINGGQLYNLNYNKHIKMSANKQNNDTEHSNKRKKMSLFEKVICGFTITYITLFIIFGLLKIFRKPPSI